MPTSTPTSRYNDLYLIGKYTDNRNYILQFLTLRTYSAVFKHVILSLLSSSYDDIRSAIASNADISDFVICQIFSSSLSSTDRECVSYSDVMQDTDEDEEEGEYVLTAVFDIVSDEKMHAYKQWLMNEVISPNFHIKVANLMNEQLNNITLSNGRRRRLVGAYDYFSVMDLSVIDANNVTKSDSDEQLLSPSSASAEVTTTIAVGVGVPALLLLIVIVAFVYYYKMKSRRKENKVQADNNTNEYAEEVEMNKVENVNEIEGGDDDQRQPGNEGMGVNEEGHEEIVDEVNETYQQIAVDEQIVHAINQTSELVDDEAEENDEAVFVV